MSKDLNISTKPKQQLQLCRSSFSSEQPDFFNYTACPDNIIARQFVEKVVKFVLGQPHWEQVVTRTYYSDLITVYSSQGLILKKEDREQRLVSEHRITRRTSSTKRFPSVTPFDRHTAQICGSRTTYFALDFDTYCSEYTLPSFTEEIEF